MTENADLLRRLDAWREGDHDTGSLIRWAAAHLRGCVRDDIEGAIAASNAKYDALIAESRATALRAYAIAGPIASEDAEDFYGGVAPAGREVL